MKVDFSQNILGLDNQPMDIGGQCRACGHIEASGTLTLGMVAARALTETRPQDERLSGDEKYRMGMLALRISFADNPLQLTIDEIAIIRTRVDILYGPLIVARVREMLDRMEE